MYTFTQRRLRYQQGGGLQMLEVYEYEKWENKPSITNVIMMNDRNREKKIITEQQEVQHICVWMIRSGSIPQFSPLCHQPRPNSTFSPKIQELPEELGFSEDRKGKDNDFVASNIHVFLLVFASFAYTRIQRNHEQGCVPPVSSHDEKIYTALHPVLKIRSNYI